MEKPTRMNLENCEVDMPSMNDLWNEIRHISGEAKAQSIPMDCYQSLSSWLMLLNITTAMTWTFARHNRLHGPKTLLEEAEQVEQKLEQHARKPADWNKDVTAPLSCFAKQVQAYVG